uniref:NAC domain-containing protein n=1 Tax=Nymphaea colorata TaxID=210225 RepID=A0A5K0VGM2_9MAGN
MDDWVLCRIYNKKGFSHMPVKPKPSNSSNSWEYNSSMVEEEKPEVTHLNRTQLMARPPADFVQMDSSDSVPRLHATDSSCSEHVLSPEITCDREVQSEFKWKEWERGFDSGVTFESLMSSSFPQLEDPQYPPQPLLREPSFSDVLMFLQKPF